MFEFPMFVDNIFVLKICVLLIIFILIEWKGREHKYAIEYLGLKWKRPYRISVYYIIVFSIVWFAGQQQEFIYFQF